MAAVNDSPILLEGARRLPDGLTVRLRLARPADLSELRALMRRADVGVDDVALQRLLLFDPRKRAVICAAAWMGGREALVGVGAIDLAPGAEPDFLWAPDLFREHVSPLVDAALRNRASARAGKAA
ncbi:MAG TPA: hypothetical protein VHE14_00115 [Solirubrobacteraceae bacterium]|nr:hypothetical protein [Solirubrobacteraceae bacterium]